MADKIKANCSRLFILLLLFAAVFFIYSIIKNRYHFDIKNLNSSLEDVTINFTLDKKIGENNILLCFDNYCVPPEADIYKNVYSYSFNHDDKNFSKINKIHIAFPYIDDKVQKALKNNISEIFLFVGNKTLYYNRENIKEFPAKNFSIKLDNSDNDAKYSAFLLPEVDNYKGGLNNLAVSFLSLFYNWQQFLLGYIALFLAYLLYLFYGIEFPKIPSHRQILILILLLGFFLRLNNISYNPFWLDEVYTQTVAVKSLKSVFCDAGNPPLYYFLQFLVLKIFPASYLSLRAISLVSGVGFIYFIYLIFEKCSKNFALFASFLASINIINIFHSQDARSYSLCMFLSVCAIYYLFRYLKKPDLKNLLIYFMISIMCVNVHYYLILFTALSALWGIGVLILKKRGAREVLNFSLLSTVSFLTLIPYFMISYKNAIGEGFNAWIRELSSETYISLINQYFLNKYIFALFILLLVLNLFLCFNRKLRYRINPQKARLLIYLTYIIFSFIVCVSLISIVIKPVLNERIFMALYGVIFLEEMILITSVLKFRKKANVAARIFSIVLIFLYFSITVPFSYRKAYTADEYMNFIFYDAEKFQKEGYEIHCFIPDYLEYINLYEKIRDNKNIIWHKIDANQSKFGSEKKISKKDYTDRDKAVFYVSSIASTLASSALSRRVSVYAGNVSALMRIVFD